MCSTWSQALTAYAKVSFDLVTLMPAETYRLSDEFWTESELAEQLGKSTRTIMRMRAQRVGPPWRRLGLTVIYPKALALDWIHADVIAPVRERRARARKSSPRPPPSD
jgi:hypothetical protein